MNLKPGEAIEIPFPSDLLRKIAEADKAGKKVSIAAMDPVQVGENRFSRDFDVVIDEVVIATVTVEYSGTMGGFRLEGPCQKN